MPARIWIWRLWNVTCSHKMILKSRHAVPRFSLKTVVGVNLGEIEIFALCHSSFIFTPYTCSFLLYLTHKCLKFCKWSTYWSSRHWEMTPKWPIFTEGLLSVTHASHTKTKVTISRWHGCLRSSNRKSRLSKVWCKQSTKSEPIRGRV